MDLTDTKTQAEILGVGVLMGLVFVHYVIYDKETQETYVSRIKPKEEEIDFESGTKAIIGEIHLSENKEISIVTDGYVEEPEEGETRWYLVKGEGLEKE